MRTIWARRTSARLALAVGVLALGLALLALLAHAEPRLAGSNDVPAASVLARTPATGTRFCQRGELLPAGTAALRLSLRAAGGPAVQVAATRAGRTLARGTHAGGWRGAGVTVALRPAAQRDARVAVCVTLAGGGPVAVLGSGGRMRISYLRAGRESWLALAPTLAERAAPGLGTDGTPIAVVCLLLMLGAVAVALRETGREEP